MGGDYELAALLRELMQSGQHGHLPQRRQGRLRLIEQIQAFPSQAVLKQSKEALTVGAFV